MRPSEPAAIQINADQSHFRLRPICSRQREAGLQEGLSITGKVVEFTNGNTCMPVQTLRKRNMRQSYDSRRPTILTFADDPTNRCSTDSTKPGCSRTPGSCRHFGTAGAITVTTPTCCRSSVVLDSTRTSIKQPALVARSTSQRAAISISGERPGPIHEGPLIWPQVSLASGIYSRTIRWPILHRALRGCRRPFPSQPDSLSLTQGGANRQ